MTDIEKRMRNYLTRLAESHTEAVAKILKKRDVAALDQVPDADLFAFSEELRAAVGLETGFMLARAQGISLTADDDDETDPATTARAINEIALGFYKKADSGASLIDAVPPGSSIAEAMQFMGAASNTLRRRGL